MDDRYESLGFKKPDYVENQYGIRIYLGTSGEDDWCLEIPKELVKKKYSDCAYNCTCNFILYFITEETALRTAQIYTDFAKGEKK